MKDKVLHAKTSFLCSKEKTTGKRLTGKKATGWKESMEERWSLPDPERAVQWCTERNKQNIRCILAILADYAMTPEVSARSLISHLGGITLIGERSPGTSFSAKPSAIGILFDVRQYTRNIFLLVHQARRLGVPFEIDMEGRSLVDDTLKSAIDLAREGETVTLALQAYLDRTSDDLAACINAEITVRLVKGAYLGDTNDFTLIQKRFRSHAETLINAGIPFSAATHDPEIIEWLKDKMRSRKNTIEFGFLKGLADRTKSELSEEGWKVAEYVPFGPGGQAYYQRRELYLKNLSRLGRFPVP